MDSITLHSCVQYLAHGAADVYTLARDQLHQAKFLKNTLIVIANTGSSQSQGEHWVVFYTYKGSQGNLKTDFYDSFGNRPEFFGLEYPYEITKYNSTCHQNDRSNYCGHLVLYFIYVRLRRYPLYHALASFSTDKDRNEKRALGLFVKIISVAGRNIRPNFSCTNYGCLPKNQVMRKYAPKQNYN